MFRNCFFKYAGISSEKYNLKLCYVKNQYYDFNSGGDYKLQTGSIPLALEQKYYGKDYSETPLEFEIEIMNYDDDIPFEQMIEIKNWLFEQDGYKRLELKNEWSKYHLNCVFVPKGEITERNHYKGLRCTLKNASPFWYGNTQEIVVGHSTLIANLFSSGSVKDWSVIKLSIPQNKNVNCVILPEILFDINRTSNSNFEDHYQFKMTTVDVSNLNEAIALSDGKFSVEDKTFVGFDSLYLDDDGQANATDMVSVDTKYGIIISQKYPNKIIYPLIDYKKSFLKLHYGDNYCRIYSPQAIMSITIKYTPLYRLGAF